MAPGGCPGGKATRCAVWVALGSVGEEKTSRGERESAIFAHPMQNPKPKTPSQERSRPPFFYCREAVRWCRMYVLALSPPAGGRRRGGGAPTLTADIVDAAAARSRMQMLPPLRVGEGVARVPPHP